MYNTENICTHFAEDKNLNYTPVSPAIIQSSNFIFDTYEDFLKICDDEKNNYMYTRGTNPTTEILEKKLAKLENGEKCKVFSSGMGAISATILALLKSNDHILTLNIIYGQTISFINELSKFNIEHNNIFVNSIEDIKNNIKNNTKIIYMESPCSQTMKLLDIEKIAKLAKEKNILTIIDNTWSTPIFQKPINYGIDIVIHSCSKYIGGNSDVVAGAVISKTEIINKIFGFSHQNLGAVNSPFDSWLLIRSLRTLPIRLQQHNKNIKKIINFLKKDSRIKEIYHPYAFKDEQKTLSDKYLKGYTSLLSFNLKDDNFNKLKIFVNNLKIIQIGVSWGGYESLILPAYKLNNDEQLKQRNLSKTHIRLYIGLENTESLINDLKQALDIAYNK